MNPPDLDSTLGPRVLTLRIIIGALCSAAWPSWHSWSFLCGEVETGVTRWIMDQQELIQ